jgi:hypothetical protein
LVTRDIANELATDAEILEQILIRYNLGMDVAFISNLLIIVEKFNTPDLQNFSFYSPISLSQRKMRKI